MQTTNNSPKDLSPEFRIILYPIIKEYYSGKE